MKNNFSILQWAFKAIALCLCLATAGTTRAQVLVSPYPVMPSTWFTTSGTVQGLNTAAINFPYLGGIVPVFAGVSWDGSTAKSEISIFGTTGYIGPDFSLRPVAGTPDIALANDPTGTAGVDFVAVYAYPTSTGVQVDYYKFSQSGGTIIGSGFSTTSSICSLGHSPSTVHIDVIADYHDIVPSSSGFPNCHHVVVTWDDPSGTGHVSAAFIDLFSLPTTLAVQTISNSGKSPDVAAIIRNVGLSRDEIALVTYTNSTGTALYYKEWDITALTLSTATTLDAGEVGTSIAVPRIDAIDDFNNNSALSGHANYKVAAQVDSSGYYLVRTYDNILNAGLTTFWDCSQIADLSVLGTYSAPPYGHFAPAVSMGGNYVSALNPNDATDYMVTDYIHTSGADILMMEPINYSNSTFLANTNGAYNYYWVSDTPAVTTSGYANAVSSPCNSPTSINSSVIAWAVASGTGSAIEYKISPYYYAFKHPETNGTATVVQNENWQVYPNPTTNFIAINYTGTAVANANYRIVDMLGRTVLAGSLISNNEQIDLRRIPAGNYILKLSGENLPGENEMIVKQ